MSKKDVKKDFRFFFELNMTFKIFLFMIIYKHFSKCSTPTYYEDVKIHRKT